MKAVLGTSAVSLIDASIAGATGPLYLGSAAPPGNPTAWLDVTAHTRDGVLILELEPGTRRPLVGAQVLASVRRISEDLEHASDLDRLLQVAVRAVRSLTGFDRVMIYRFLEEDGAGSVIAEDRGDAISPFLNHHYPAPDIPKQARALYLKNLVRVIPDVS